MAGRRQVMADGPTGGQAEVRTSGVEVAAGDGVSTNADILLVWAGRFAVILWLVFSLFHHGYFVEEERVYGLLAALPCLAVVVAWAIAHRRNLSSLWSLGRILVGVGAMLAVSLVFSTYVHASYMELVSFVALAALSAATFVGFGSRSGLVALGVLVVGVGTSIPIAGLLSVVLSRIPGLVLAVVLQRVFATTLGGRLSSVFGYPNALAAFLALPMMISAGFAVGGRTSRARIGGIATGAIMMAAFLMTQSRVSVVVTFAGLLAVGAVAMVPGFLSVRERRRTALGFAGIALALVIVTVTPSLRQSVISPLLARFTAGGQAASQNFGQRLGMILDGLRCWLHYPVLGTGAGTYEFNYMRFRTQMFFSTDPHSLPIKILTETGIVGALAWLALLTGFIAFIIRCVRSDERNRVVVLFAFVGLCVQLLHACLDWDWLFMVSPAMLFIVGGAAVGAMREGEDPVSRIIRRLLVGRTATGSGHARPGAAMHHSPVIPRPHQLVAPIAICTVAAMYIVAVSLLGVSLKYALRAKQQDQSSDIVLAKENYARAISADPGNADLHYRLAQNQNTMDQKVYNGSFLPIRDTIKKEFKQAILLNRWYPLYLSEYGAFLMRVGDADAVDVYARLVQANQYDPDVYAVRAASVRFFKHDDALAQQYIDQAFALDPSNFLALQIQGAIRESAGNLAGALDAFRAAIRVKPEEPQPYALAGHVLEVQHRTAEATLLYSEGISATGGNSTLVQSLERLGPYVKVTMPATAWSLSAGQKIGMQWSVTSPAAVASFTVELASTAGGTSYALAERLPSSARSATLTIPAGAVPGKYRLRVWAYAVGSLQQVSFGDSRVGTVAK